MLFFALVTVGLAAATVSAGLMTVKAAPQPIMPLASTYSGPGGTLPGLSASELAPFYDGRAHFLEVETVPDGLGPTFNSASCANCHAIPAVGGGAFVTEVRAGQRFPDGSFAAPGGSLFQLFSIPDHECEVQIPDQANVIARRISLSILGDGLIEGIPDQDILDYAASPKPYGITGTAAIITDVVSGLPRVGRFGWKPQQATLLAFAGDAYVNEMGITNDLFPHEVRGQACDMVPDPVDTPDPATGRTAIQDFANFMKFLAPPDRASNQNSPSVTQGEKVFNSVGCAICHKTSYTTGGSDTVPLNHKAVNLYSDLLLHDVGTGEGILQAAAAANQLRTRPPWGLRFRKPLLRDGSAISVVDAIYRHGGEAAVVIYNYQQLSPRTGPTFWHSWDHCENDRADDHDLGSFPQGVGVQVPSSPPPQSPLFSGLFVRA